MALHPMPRFPFTVGGSFKLVVSGLCFMPLSGEVFFAHAWPDMLKFDALSVEMLVISGHSAI